MPPHPDNASGGSPDMPADLRPGLIYARRSVEDEDNPALSVPFQVDMGREEMGRRGILVPPSNIFTDRNRSGKDLDRPGMQGALALIHAGAVQAVWVYNLDRLTRNLYDLPILQAAADRGRCIIIAGSRILDWENPEQEVGLIVEATFAQYYRKRIAKNTRQVLARKFAAGDFPGGDVPYGFHLVAGVPVPNPAESPIAVRVFREFAIEGWPTTRIAAGLTEDGVPTPRGGRVWYVSTVRNILNAPAHHGRWERAGMERDWPFARIVPPDLAAAAFQRLKGNERRRGPNAVRYVWRGILRCGLCGDPMHRSMTMVGGKRYTRYACNRAVCGPVRGLDRCRQRPLQELHLDGLEAEVLARVAVSQPVPRPRRPVTDTEAERDAAERRMAVADAMLRMERLTLAEYEAEIRAARAILQSLQAEAHPAGPEHYQNLAGRWEQMPIGERNAAFRLLLSRVEVYPTHIDAVFNDPGWDRWPQRIRRDRKTGAMGVLQDGKWLRD